MMVKLDIYRKFTNALAVAVIMSVGWTCYEVIIRIEKPIVSMQTCKHTLDFTIFLGFFLFGECLVT